MEGSIFKAHSIARWHLSSRCNTATRCIKTISNIKIEEIKCGVEEYLLQFHESLEKEYNTNINMATWKEAAISARVLLSSLLAEERGIAASLQEKIYTKSYKKENTATK